jgi:hypothetical protein
MGKSLKIISRVNLILKKSLDASHNAPNIRDSDLVDLLKSMVDLFERLKNEDFDNYVHITLSYIFKAGDVKDEDGFRKVIRSNLSNDDKEIVMILLITDY